MTKIINSKLVPLECLTGLLGRADVLVFEF